MDCYTNGSVLWTAVNKKNNKKKKAPEYGITKKWTYPLYTNVPFLQYRYDVCINLMCINRNACPWENKTPPHAVDRRRASIGPETAGRRSTALLLFSSLGRPRPIVPHTHAHTQKNPSLYVRPIRLLLLRDLNRSHLLPPIPTCAHLLTATHTHPHTLPFPL